MTNLESKITPKHYHLRLEPDPDRLDFSATLTLQAVAQQSVDVIELDALDLAVWSCRVGKGENRTACPFCLDPAREKIRIDLPEKITGEIEIQIDYCGRINSQMAGFYHSTYRHSNGSEKIAVTQFQESDARRAFACMDHPLYKADFTIEMIVDREVTAISNMPAASENPEPGGRKRVIFETTPVMSTYLVFFGMGRFSVITDELDRRVRAAVLPGMEENVRYGLAFARKALKYCETCFASPYPLPKLDLIAVPDFAFGAMENWGAITFRENLLLFDPANTAADGQERICEVIAHEIVHQWFGNLVTPEDWKFLWLNESFATFYGYQVVDAHCPDWQIWEEFVESQTATALNRDSLRETSAIEISGGSHVVINSATAPIIYSKGASILRQIRGYMGEKEFEAGLHRYLAGHSGGCAGSSDMWTAMESASGKPIRHIMQHWVLQPGHPLVTARQSNGRLQLSQKRFSYLPAPGAQNQTWPVAVIIRWFDATGASRTTTALMDGPEMEMEMDPDVYAYKTNDLQTGFYRTQYKDPQNLERLAAMAAAKTLPAIDRWGLENDLFALTVAGDSDLPAYLDFLEQTESDTDPLPLSAKMGHLHDLMIAADGPGAQAVAAAAARHMQQAFDVLGCSPEKDEPHGRLRVRNNLFWQAAVLGVSGPVSAAGEEFEKLRNQGRVHPDILRGVMQAAAWQGDEKTFSWFVDRMENTDSEQDRLNCLRALGSFRRPELLENALALVLDRVPDKNKFVPVAQMARNPAAIPLLWDWYTGAEKILDHIHPIIHERIITSVVPTGGLDCAEAAAEHFKHRMAENPPAADAIAMALEKLEVNLQIRGQVAASFA
ncbi:MAG: M1 family metallopeptidase [Desulfobacterales bacterium]|nr:M1 family metallopeptidase [Desulfobacterales bacterium]